MSKDVTSKSVSPGSQKRIARSPAEWRGSSAKRQPPEEVAHLPRSELEREREREIVHIPCFNASITVCHVLGSYHTVGRVPRKPNRGQRSVARPMMIGTYGNTDVAIQVSSKFT